MTVVPQFIITLLLSRFYPGLFYRLRSEIIAQIYAPLSCTVDSKGSRIVDDQRVKTRRRKTIESAGTWLPR